MGRSGYSDDYGDEDPLALARWRGQVASAMRGKRGQAFLIELRDALDAMPDKRLIRDEFWNGESCALGVVAERRGVDVISIEPEDYDRLADIFGIAHQMVQEIEFMNDEAYWHGTPEARWGQMRQWVEVNIKKPDPVPGQAHSDRRG